MTTLSQAPVPAVLDRLFAEAAAASPSNSPAFTTLSAEERSRLMQSGIL